MHAGTANPLESRCSQKKSEMDGRRGERSNQRHDFFLFQEKVRTRVRVRDSKLFLRTVTIVVSFATTGLISTCSGVTASLVPRCKVCRRRRTCRDQRAGPTAGTVASVNSSSLDWRKVTGTTKCERVPNGTRAGTTFFCNDVNDVFGPERVRHPAS